MLQYDTKINEALSSIKTIIKETKIAIILSPGFEGVADMIEDMDVIDCCDIPNFPQANMQESIDAFVVGKLQGKKVICISAAQCCSTNIATQKADFMMTLFHKIGVKHLIVINSAISLDSQIKAGDVAIINKRVDLLKCDASKNDDIKSDTNILEIVKAISNMLEVDIIQAQYGYISTEHDNFISDKQSLQTDFNIIGMPTLLEFVSGTYHTSIIHLSYITQNGTRASEAFKDLTKEFEIPVCLKRKYAALMNEIIAVL